MQIAAYSEDLNYNEKVSDVKIRAKSWAIFSASLINALKLWSTNVPNQSCKAILSWLNKKDKKSNTVAGWWWCIYDVASIFKNIEASSSTICDRVNLFWHISFWQMLISMGFTSRSLEYIRKQDPTTKRYSLLLAKPAATYLSDIIIERYRMFLQSEFIACKVLVSQSRILNLSFISKALAKF